MNSLEQKIGMQIASFTYVIERGKIKEFVQAIGDNNSIYYDLKEALKQGYNDIPIPPTFPTCIEMWAGANFDELIEQLELNPLHVLHGEQSYQYHKDVCAGDTIYGKTIVKHIERKKNMTFVTLQTDYFNENDDLVLTATSTILERQEVNDK